MFGSPRRPATTTRTRWHRRAALILTGLATGTGVMLAGAPAASAATVPNGESYRITTAYTGLAMDVEAASGDDDAKVVQNPVNIGSASQAWQFLQQPNGSYELRNANSGKCLSVYYNSTAAGAKLVQYHCHGWTDQQWQLAGMGGPTLAIQSVLSSYRVDVPGGTIAWNTQLQQWPSYRGYEPNQWFYLTPVNIAAG